MRDTNAHNEREGRDLDESPHDDPLAGYTPEQRETFLKGFRILADVAIRAHMGRQASSSLLDDDETEPAGEEA